MNGHRILVTGSRNWTDHTTVETALAAAWRSLGQLPDITLVHGAARGLDTLAARVWSARGYPTEAHPADWDTHGKRAGIIRNQHMVDLGADVCLAFPIGESRGTRHCIRAATAAGIHVVTYEG